MIVRNSIGVSWRTGSRSVAYAPRWILLEVLASLGFKIRTKRLYDQVTLRLLLTDNDDQLKRSGFSLSADARFSGTDTFLDYKSRIWG